MPFVHHQQRVLVIVGILPGDTMARGVFHNGGGSVLLIQYQGLICDVGDAD